MHDEFMAVRKPAALIVLTGKWEIVKRFGTPEHWAVGVGSLLPW
jgi:hypothetical protein